MPSWNDLLNQTNSAGSVQDIVRREALAHLHDVTGRNAIIYYSAWLEKSELWERTASPFTVNDVEMNGFMACVHGLDRSKGLDLVLHTPGGDVAATEALVTYLRAMFGNLRVAHLATALANRLGEGARLARHPSDVCLAR